MLTEMEMLDIHTAQLRKRGYLHHSVDLKYVSQLVEGFNENTILEVVKNALENSIFRNGEVIDAYKPLAVHSFKPLAVKLEDFIKAIDKLKDNRNLNESDVDGRFFLGLLPSVDNKNIDNVRFEVYHNVHKANSEIIIRDDNSPTTPTVEIGTILEYISNLDDIGLIKDNLRCIKLAYPFYNLK